MRMMGHNVLAIAAAAIVIYLLEFAIFGVLITPEQYETMTGLSPEQHAAGASRMPLGAIIPIMTAIGLALVIKWRNAPGLMGGVTTALLVAVLFGFSTSLYAYVYGAHADGYLPINLGHFLVCYAAGGAIIGAWK